MPDDRIAWFRQAPDATVISVLNQRDRLLEENAQLKDILEALRIIITNASLSQKAKLVYAYFLARYPESEMRGLVIGEATKDLGMGVDTFIKACQELDQAGCWAKEKPIKELTKERIEAGDQS